ncbi:MAG: hypothetical protein JNK82_43190 [Myxococcaceae bacterium]|nr:hypothetical protein [Myxococcaceae bacterium]
MKARIMILSLVVSLQASAAGLVVEASNVVGARELQAKIAAARVSDAQTFATVAQLSRDADTLFAKRRGGVVAPMGRTFKQLGPQALLPMLELLAFDAANVPATEGGRLTLTVGLLEAVGALQSDVAAPVLEAVLANLTVSPLVTRAAADAYGFLQTDDAASRLLVLSLPRTAHGRAVREGMGSCRRAVIAKRLGDAVMEATEVREQVEAARALGDVGNAWAWQTPGVTAKREEAEVRRTAAAALVRAFVARTGDARQAASNALLVVNANETHSLILAALVNANAEQKAALTELQARLEQNPVR